MEEYICIDAIQHFTQPKHIVTLQQFLFRSRSYTPLPFVVVMFVWAQPTPQSLLTGGCIALLGECFRAWGVSYAGSETRTTGSVGASKLVTSGPFAHVRNPLYCGNIILYIGLGIMSNALFPYLQLIAFMYFIFQYILIVREEEMFLRKTFGDEYLHYCDVVPRFFPRLTKYPNPHQIQSDWKSALRSETRTLQALLFVVVILIIRWKLRY